MSAKVAAQLDAADAAKRIGPHREVTVGDQRTGRTAKSQKRGALTAPAGEKPILTVSELDLKEDEDWYTPQVLKVAPLRIEATLGKKGKGRVRCAIEETDWERRHVDLCFAFEKGGCTGFHSSTSDEFGPGTIGTFTRDQIDRLIDALVIVRREADARGLFVSRPTPTSAEEVLAAAGGTRGGIARIKWPRLPA